ncbi:MAG TPA: HD domain-containing phosphohydrolase [Anaerolineales bacterium]|nr:HD domain-containing phosphohydrolase [Anaerolineales bacterium]
MNKETLLVVEDNPVLREGLQDILAHEGYQVLTASNGKEALDRLSLTSPDLILSDISMPTMDGYALFQAVRTRPEWVTIPFIFLTARGERSDVLTGKNLGAEDYLVKPLTRDELLTAVNARLNRSHQLQVAQLQQAYETSLTMLASSIDMRDPTTHGHVERVAAYCHTLALELGWQGRLLDNLRFGAILHDIGKIMISEHVLSKDGPLSEAEWVEIKKHPVTGAEMIRDIPFLAPAVPVVRHHHERWDGLGYPDGLQGEAIPAGARLVALADGFDALSTDRPYRLAVPPERAYAEVCTCAGREYDPEVVAAFQFAWERGRLQPILAPWLK